MRNIPDGVFNFSYSSPFYSVTSTEQVEVRNLNWNTPANTTRYVGEPFTITGNCIDGHGYSIIGNRFGEGAIAQNGQISFIIPGYVIGIVPAFAPKGKSAIEMKLNDTTIKYKDLFEFYRRLITNAHQDSSIFI